MDATKTETQTEQIVGEFIEVDLQNICRICASITETLLSIYEAPHLIEELDKRINTYLPIAVNLFSNTEPQIHCLIYYLRFFLI